MAVGEGERGAKERRVCRFLADAGLRGVFAAVRRRAGAILRLVLRVVCVCEAMRIESGCGKIHTSCTPRAFVIDGAKAFHATMT